MQKFLPQHCVCGLSFEGQLPLSASPSVACRLPPAASPLSLRPQSQAQWSCLFAQLTAKVNSLPMQTNSRTGGVGGKLFKTHPETICLLAAPPTPPVLPLQRMKIIIKRIKNN